ncbi:MAG: beta-ketoacyl synthase N-terminal-like domain-containing protein, partial [Myxococcota bacterium]
MAEVRGEDLPPSFTPTTGFVEAGLDSLMAVELVRRVSRQIDRPLPATVAFDHPDLESLTAFVLQTLELAETEPLPVEVARAPTPDDDRIAIVGMGCRFPGADTPEALWELLLRGDQPIVEVPTDRWDVDAWYDPDARGALDRSYVRSGGFIDDIDQFDPEFFGISPREADGLDPQQRILLEVAHEALERAGHATRALRHSRTGVFVGIEDRHYLERFRRPGRPRYPDAWSGMGSDASFAAGRVAHALGLQGPAVSVNTTCSSSLVALHLARQALLRGECDRALAGGVSLMLLPDDTAYLCSIGALSPTERCHTFDRSADGYVRSEGCGVVVLRRLSDALADGDAVLAVIAGSALNHDGPSAGLTVPNGAAQSEVIRAALADAGRSPDELGYVEAHGTGTPLGDPIEIHALQMVLGDRGSQPDVVVGAVKAHLGHLELAAGAASLVKTVLVLQHQQIPGQPLRELNPEIDDTGIHIPTRTVPWPDRTRLAGISGFGLSGTNAHVLLERGPVGGARAEGDGETRGRAAAPPRPVQLLALSAKSETSLAETIRTLPLDEPLAGVARAVHARGPYALRTAVVAADGDEARVALAEASTQRSGTAPGVAFLFSGQGSQVAKAANTIAAVWPAFDTHLGHCADVLDPILGQPLRELLDDEDALVRTEFTQPALLAVQTGLARLLEGFGVVPSVVLGHSLGELTAATVAGIFDLDDGLRLVATRGRLMADRAAEGAMIAVFATPDAVRPHLPDGAEIAAINGIEEVAVAGPPEAIGQAITALEAAGLQIRRLATSRPFHSAAVDPLLDAWAEAVAAVPTHPPRIDDVDA